MKLNNGIWMRFELVESESEILNRDRYCKSCNENEENININELLDIYVDRIQDVAPCSSCIREALEDLIEDIMG